MPSSSLLDIRKTCEHLANRLNNSRIYKRSPSFFYPLPFNYLSLYHQALLAQSPINSNSLLFKYTLKQNLKRSPLEVKFGKVSKKSKDIKLSRKCCNQGLCSNKRIKLIRLYYHLKRQILILDLKQFNSPTHNFISADGLKNLTSQTPISSFAN